MKAWRSYVQYRWTCAVCEEPRLCSVVRRKNGETLRLCETCYEDGWWRK